MATGRLSRTSRLYLWHFQHEGDHTGLRKHFLHLHMPGTSVSDKQSPESRRDVYPDKDLPLLPQNLPD